MGTRWWIAASSSDRPPGPRLGRAFFDRPADEVAPELLGATLCVRDPTGLRTARLVETEAYLRGDPASHTFRGPTPRNRSMYARPGTLYVFRIHQVVCANLVTRRAEAVLLRAAELPGSPAEAGRGPGRLCRALGLTRDDDGVDAVIGDRCAVLARPERPPETGIGPRVGIRLAAEQELRFWIVGSPAVSRWRPLSGGASPNRTRDGGGSRRSRTTSRRASAGGRSGVRSVGR